MPQYEWLVKQAGERGETHPAFRFLRPWGLGGWATGRFRTGAHKDAYVSPVS